MRLTENIRFQNSTNMSSVRTLEVMPYVISLKKYKWNFLQKLLSDTGSNSAILYKVLRYRGTKRVQVFFDILIPRTEISKTKLRKNIIGYLSGN